MIHGQLVAAAAAAAAAAAYFFAVEARGGENLKTKPVIGFQNQSLLQNGKLKKDEVYKRFSGSFYYWFSVMNCPIPSAHGERWENFVRSFT
jgi:hypothetical protein